jgi:hypothetical protein
LIAVSYTAAPAVPVIVSTPTNGPTPGFKPSFLGRRRLAREKTEDRR